MTMLTMQQRKRARLVESVWRRLRPDFERALTETLDELDSGVDAASGDGDVESESDYIAKRAAVQLSKLQEKRASRITH